jgi:hypothetical protein
MAVRRRAARDGQEKTPLAAGPSLISEETSLEGTMQTAVRTRCWPNGGGAAWYAGSPPRVSAAGNQRRSGIAPGRPAPGGGGRLSPTNVRTRRKATFERGTGGPLFSLPPHAELSPLFVFVPQIMLLKSAEFSSAFLRPLPFEDGRRPTAL